MNHFKSKIIQSITPLAVLFALVLFLNHLVCTILYLAPINPSTRYYSSYVRGYINPFFTQRWLLFAPEPQVSQAKLIYRCKANNQWSGWADPAFETIERHQAFRFGYYGKASFVFAGITRDLHNLNITKLTDAELNKAPEFLNARKLVSSYCLNLNSNANSFEFSLLNMRVKNYSERKEPGYFGKILRVDFPEMNI